MEIKDYPNYQALPKEIKPDYKPANDKGDFVKETTLENSEITHQIALLENDAFGELEESVEKSKLSISEIMEKLSDSGLDYNEKDALRDLLFQNIDLQELKGNPVDEKVDKFLEKSYSTPRHSRILADRIVKGIKIGESGIIGEVLKDKKARLIENNLIQKLTSDEQRVKAFNICKENKKTALTIVNKIENIDLALKMYLQILESSDKESYSDNTELANSGKALAKKLFQSGAKEQLINLIKLDTFKLSYYKKFVHLFGREQETIIDLVNNSSDIDDIFYALKFITNQELLAKIETDPDFFTKLTKEQVDRVTQYAKDITQALNAEPKIIALSNLNEDGDREYKNSGKVARNKFVIGILDGKYIIAWSNMKDNENHRDIFKEIGYNIKAKSGGYIGLDEENGKTKIRMVRLSGDYGFYSKELLEYYRIQLEKSLQEALGRKEFELDIKTSTDYE